jgi:hypothetical protein
MLIVAGGGHGVPLDYGELGRWTRVGYERERQCARGAVSAAAIMLAMPRADRLSLDAAGLKMPSVDQMSNRGSLNVVLDRTFSGLPAGLPNSRMLVGVCRGHMADSLASKAGRTRPPVVGGWLGPVLSSFVTANLECETNFLRPDIRVGRVVASMGAPSLEMSLPFGRRDLQLVRSGSAAVLRVDAVRGSPDGDFTKKGGCRVAARWCP